MAYPTSVVPRRWLAAFGLNPMVGVVEGFRWALLGAGKAPGPGGIRVAVMVLVLGNGLYYFRRMEASFADVI